MYSQTEGNSGTPLLKTVSMRFWLYRHFLMPLVEKITEYSAFAKLILKQGSQRFQGFSGILPRRRNPDFTAVRANQRHDIEDAFPVNTVTALGNPDIGFKLTGNLHDLRCNSCMNSQLVGNDEVLFENRHLSQMKPNCQVVAPIFESRRLLAYGMSEVNCDAVAIARFASLGLTLRCANLLSTFQQAHKRALPSLQEPIV